MNRMNQEEIKTFLPHREPMLLLDEVSLLSAKESKGRFAIPENAYFLQGHFPGFPVVPGVILCEIIAQTAGVLVREELQKGKTPLFIGMENVRFRRMVRPKDEVHTTCQLLRASGTLVKIRGEARVEGQVAAEGDFLLMLQDIDARDV